MSTHIQVSPKSGITIGTTPITGGAIGRVLFEGIGNVSQEDANFTFDSTLKRLTLKAVGTTATDIPLSISNSAGTKNLFEFNGKGTLLSNTVWTDGPWTTHFAGEQYTGTYLQGRVYVKSIYDGGEESIYLGKNNGSANNNTSSSSGIVYSHNGTFTVRNTNPSGFYGITLNTSQNNEQRVGIDTDTSSWGLGWALRNFTTGIDHINFKTNANRTGIGWNDRTDSKLIAVLDVKAQGALSTDIAFRVRNSADTANLFYTLGNGTSGTPWGDAYTLQYGDTNFGATISKNGQFGTHIRIFQFSGAASTVMSEAGFATFGNLSLGLNTVSSYRILSSTGLGTEADHILLSQPQNGTRKASMLFNTNYSAGVSYNTARLQVETYVANSVDRTKFNFWATNGGFNIAPTIIGSLTCKSNLLLGTPTEDINDSNTLYIPNGTAPTSSITDGVKQYSADITAGNAAPHFRTEDGSVIKLYKQDLSTNPTNAELATFLSNLGLANLI